MSIVSFRDDEAKRFFRAGKCRRFANLVRVLARKLDMLDAATVLSDLKSPPSNQSEALKHDRTGQHSICVNDRWRICFVWTEAGPTNIEFVDYH